MATSDAAPQTARCIVCREDIRAGARVCTHCDSAQDWTRHLARWSTVAAAVLGLGSLVSAAYSLWKLVPSPAKIEAITLSCRKDSISLALVNVGDKPGAVRNVTLRIKSAGKSMDPISLSSERREENPIIEAGKTAAINYIYRIANAPSPFPAVPAGASCQYFLSVGVADFSGTAVPATTQCDCPS